MPLNKIGSLNKINRAFAKLEQEFERDPTQEEIAKVVEISLTDIKDTMRSSGRHVSMDAPLPNGEDTTMMDVMESKDSVQPDSSLLSESLRREIERALLTLTQREADILRLYFGLTIEQSMTLEEIGQYFDLTRERVRQIKEKAIRRLKHTSRSNILKTYLG